MVNAFAECNGQYSGWNLTHRAWGANSAIEEGRQTVADIRALVERYCDGVFPELAADIERLDGTPETGPTNTASPPPTAPAIVRLPTRVHTPTRALPAPVPTVVATVTPAPAIARFDARSLEKEVHKLINSERISHGLPALAWDERITAIARAHSADMASKDYFSHDNQKGESPTDRAVAAGYPCRKSLGGGSFSYGLAENIWYGWEYASYTYGPGGTRYDWMSQTQLATQAVSSWMGSQGHRENILTPQYDKTGIGVGFGTADGEKHAVYLTQNFC